MAIRNERAYQMAQDWLLWVRSRKYLCSPPQKNILVSLIEKHMSKGESPDGLMSPEMSAFNISINSLDTGMLIPFISVYCDFRPKPVKTMAIDLGIGRDQFYERAHRAATIVLNNTQNLVILHGQLKREIEDFVD